MQWATCNRVKGDRMATHSTHDLPNGHTLTIVQNVDGGSGPTFAVQERDETGRFVREMNESTLHDAQMQVFAQRDAFRQECRDCGKMFPYDADADRCPRCVAENMEG